MIRIRIKPGEMTVKGHAARDAPPAAGIPDRDGNIAAQPQEQPNLVCCAVSTLVQCMAVALDALGGGKTKFTGRPGDATITWEGLDKNGETVVDAYWLGLSCLAEQYPDKISIV